VSHTKELTEKYDLTQNELVRRTAIEPARLSQLVNGKRKQIKINYIVIFWRIGYYWYKRNHELRI